MARVYFSIGSNVEPLKHIRIAVRELRRRFGPIDASPVYRNNAVGFDGADFLNLVVGADTPRNVDEICREIDAIHDLAERARPAARFVSRTLDIDLLLYGRLMTDGPPLQLPRVDVLEFAFALKPLADIAPHDRHPGTGLTYAEHWLAFDQAAHPLTRVEVDFGHPQKQAPGGPSNVY